MPARWAIASVAVLIGLSTVAFGPPMVTRPLHAWAAAWEVPVRSLSGGGGSGAVPAAPAGPCNPRTPTPSAVLIPDPAPSGTAPNGTSISVTVAVAVLNSSLPPGAINVSVPSLSAGFPTLGGAPRSVYLPPATLVPVGIGWGSAVEERAGVVLAGPVTYPTDALAVLSSEKLAVMADAPYGALFLGVLWTWDERLPNGSVVHGPWSAPTPRSDWPNSLASEFLPAPGVGAQPLTTSPILIGTNFTASLTGAVAGRYFFLELESPVTGHVGQVHGGTAPPGATILTLGLPILNYDHYLDPGPYLVHVHDGCGAMLHSLSVSAVYAPSAQIAISVRPAGCGSVSLNGTSYGDGSSPSVRPSATPFAFSASGCPGTPRWSLTGGLYFESADLLRVSASGSLTVTFG
ncbi:MAG: hypothetical protein L3K08_00345 [Thermoplasmata archaeon]|nr:hypothetical protein [Thermoplasmata archaeon]